MTKRILWKTLPAVALVVLMTAIAWILPTAAAEDTTLNVAYCNLSFDNETHIVFAIESNDDNVQLLLWHEPQEDYTYGTQTAALTPVARNVDINGTSHTVFKYTGLAAKNMTDTVYFRAYAPAPDSDSDSDSYGDVSKYSILQYALNKLGKTGTATEDEALKDVLVAMLDYGAKVQAYKDYEADRPANGNWVMITAEGGTLNDGFACDLYLPGETATLTAPATGANGGVFAGWTDADGQTVGTTATFALTVGETNQTYTAVYEVYSEGLAFTSYGNGACYVSGIGTCTDTDVKIPPVSPGGESVTGIGGNAFKDCTNLTSVTIPNGVAGIGYSAFYGCTGLASVDIPDSVTSIDGYAFYKCTSLTSIHIPAGMKSIANCVFYKCHGLSSFTYPGTTAEWGAIYKGSSWNSQTPAYTTVYCTNGTVAKDGTVTSNT